VVISLGFARARFVAHHFCDAVLVLLVCQFDRLNSVNQPFFAHVLAHRFQNRDYRLKIPCVKLLFKAAADRQTNFSEEVLALLKPLVPKLCRRLERKNIGKDSQNPLKQEHSRLQLNCVESSERHRHVCTEQSHEAIKKLVNRFHVKRVERVEHLFV